MSSVLCPRPLPNSLTWKNFSQRREQLV